MLFDEAVFSKSYLDKKKTSLHYHEVYNRSLIITFQFTQVKWYYSIHVEHTSEKYSKYPGIRLLDSWWSVLYCKDAILFLYEWSGISSKIQWITWKVMEPKG